MHMISRDRRGTASLRWELFFFCMALACPCLLPRAGARILEADHTFWLTIETVPPGAVVHAEPENGKSEGPELGRTPCMLAVDLNWESRWFRKRWELITVRSPGGFCRPSFNTNEGYRLQARLVIHKEGWNPVRIQSPIATFEYPGKDWKGKALWPVKHTLRYTLEKAETADIPAPSPRAAPRRVVLAGADEKEAPVQTGRVRVSSGVPGAEVRVDGQEAGPAPVELLLRAGPHVIEVRAGTSTVSRREIDLAPDAFLSLEAASPR